MSEYVLDGEVASLFEFLERGATAMPRDYLPEAPGVIFPGDTVLSAAGYVDGSNRLRDGWRRFGAGHYRKYVGTHTLMVRQCGGRRSEHWTIERIDDDHQTEALVVGHTPIFARSHQAAMRLAGHCHPNVRLPISGCWVVAR